MRGIEGKGEESAEREGDITLQVGNEIVQQQCGRSHTTDGKGNQFPGSPIRNSV